MLATPFADVDHNWHSQHIERVRITSLVASALLPALLLGCSQRTVGGLGSDCEILATMAAVPLAGRVTDDAQVLGTSEKERISAKLEALERDTGNQMVVVTVATLGGKDIKTFTNDLANAWGIGRKGYNDGVVLLVAPNEHKARIATGSGLKTKLPDRVCQQIMDQQILPHFRNGELAGGIDAGVDALAAELRHSA